ncbi:hypothetical protein ACNOYE_25750 [Nannocystaceae bacterium ST9]
MTNADFTRWNRAGRRRIEYVEVDAADVLERLRVEWVERLPGRWSSIDVAPVELGVDASPARRAELLRAELARVRIQYESAPRDIAWEIGRTFARACHVLLGYIDAQANEGWIETATQWESLRRMVAMLDHHPSPPASASVAIAVLSKRVAKLAVGELQVSHAPALGEPLVFENLESLEIDPRFDELRLAGWNHSPALLDARDMTWELPEGHELVTGAPVIFEQGLLGIGLATRVASVRQRRMRPERAPRDPWPLADTLAWLGPKAARVCHLEGPGVVAVERGHGLEVGDVIAWSSQDHWCFDEIAARDPVSLCLRHSTAPSLGPGTPIVRARRIQASEELRLPLEFLALGWISGGRVFVREGDLDAFTTKVEHNQVPSHRVPSVLAQIPGTVFLVGAGEPIKTRVIESAAPDWHGFEGPNAAWREQQWFLGERPGGETVALRLRELVADERSLRARFHGPAGPLVRVLGPFAICLRPRGWDSDPRTIQGRYLELERVVGPAIVGRRVLVRWPNGVHLTKVVRADAQRIEIEPPLPASSATIGGLIVHANVALFGHGLRKSDKIVGSGDATRSSQRFELPVTNVSFVADSTRTRGVRADVELLVDGRRWVQVDTLRDSGPADDHYVVRMTEAGFLAFEVGDGSHGRRLPGGLNNVRVAYRQGAGLVGNVPARALERLAQPHPAVRGLLQPAAATGGNDVQSVDALRERAPATVLALGRAVALEDFGLLIGSHSSVWQACARRQPAIDGFERVEIIVVPAGGGDLGLLAASLREYVLAHALPDVDVTVRRYDERRFDLHVKIAVDEVRHDAREVVRLVSEQLDEHMTLRRRRLGQPVELSELVERVEGCVGVLHSGVVIDDDPRLVVLRGEPHEVLLLGRLEVEVSADTVRTSERGRGARAIDARSVRVIQGVGPVRARWLADLRPTVKSLEELAGLDRGQPSQVVEHKRLRELIAKARMVIEFELPEPLIVTLASWTLAELVAHDPERLAEHHHVMHDDLVDLQGKLRRLQIALDEGAMTSIRLAEFSRDPGLLERIVLRADQTSNPAASLPAIIVAGIGPVIAGILQDPQLDCRSIADLARIDPPALRERSEPLRRAIRLAHLWEIKSKAELLLGLTLPPSLSRSGYMIVLAQLIECPISELVRFGLSEIQAEQLRQSLRLLEFALDHEPFTTLTLGDLVGVPQDDRP